MPKKQTPPRTLLDIIPGVDRTILKAMAFERIAMFVLSVAEEAKQMKAGPPQASRKPPRGAKSGSLKRRKAR